MGIAREAFEAWARGPAGYVDDQLAKYPDGSYQDSTTQLHWSIFAVGWRAGVDGDFRAKPQFPKDSEFKPFRPRPIT